MHYGQLENSEYVFAKKACQTETKIENKYHECTSNIFKLLSFSDQYTG